MNQKQKLITELTPLLKEKGYKKKGSTWYKDKSDLRILFMIDHSNYSKEEYYIILGISIKALQNNEKSPLGSDISYHVPKKNEKGEYLSAETLVKILDLWDQHFGDMTKLRRKAVEGNLPICSNGRAITFLTTVTFKC